MNVASALAKFVQNSRKRLLLTPIAALTLGGLMLLAMLAAFLINQFDETALDRERLMVKNGFTHELEQYDLMIFPETDWDKAVARIDHTVDADFADTYFGNQFYQFDGFTYTFVLNGSGKIIYASRKGARVKPADVSDLANNVGPLVEQVRQAERQRPPIMPDPVNKTHIVTKPIQANGVIRVGGQIYITVATLIQPDVGHILPLGPRAPIVITAMVVGPSTLTSFGKRYLVEGMTIAKSSKDFGHMTFVPLHAPDGHDIGALSWKAHRPGATLFYRMMVPLVGAFAILLLTGWTVVRRSVVVVDELIASEATAKHLAYHDPLTGLPNRAMMFARMPALLERLGPETPLLAVLGIDLDRFKAVNDTLGHEAGDELIKAIAERFRDVLDDPNTGFAARVGGDEFIILCLAPDRRHVEALANRCLARVLQPVASIYGQLDVGCSIGVTIIDNPFVETSNVLRQADLALYRSKANGRACITYYDLSMEDAFAARRQLEANLRNALSNNAFHMVYQPQVDPDGHMTAVEALIRWTHPELGPIAPDTFIPLAEESGLIMAIGEFVLRQVFEETKNWRHIRVAINVSAIQMRTPGFADQLIMLAARAGIDPSCYEIELTETALLGDDPATVQNFSILKRLGFIMVLDDFGTGYSSLSLLHRFQVNKIKIDRSFVSDLGEREEAEALIGAIISLAKAFKLDVIAEGVENERQMHSLIKAGCQEFQGFYTGKPMLPASIAELVGSFGSISRKHG